MPISGWQAFCASKQANDLSIWYHIYWILDIFLFHVTSSHRSFSWKLLIAFHCHRSLYHPFHLNSSHVFIVVFPSSHLISSYIPLLCPYYITKKKVGFILHVFISIPVVLIARVQTHPYIPCWFHACLKIGYPQISWSATLSQTLGSYIIYVYIYICTHEYHEICT